VGLSCLIVDDSEEFLASASRLLESQGIRVVGVASAGAEAMRLAKSLAPDVALIDIELGDEDGIDLAERLAKTDPARTVILISSHEQDDVAELLLTSCAAGFIPKNSLGRGRIEDLAR
jgi:two-component system nitrate/nitrite response regulator NarL